jgi:hypothetical protein
MISLFPVSPRAEFRVFVAGRRVSLLVISHPTRNEQPVRYVTASVFWGKGPLARRQDGLGGCSRGVRTVIYPHQCVGAVWKAFRRLLTVRGANREIVVRCSRRRTGIDQLCHPPERLPVCMCVCACVRGVL